MKKYVPLILILLLLAGCSPAESSLPSPSSPAEAPSSYYQEKEILPDEPEEVSLSQTSTLGDVWSLDADSVSTFQVQWYHSDSTVETADFSGDTARQLAEELTGRPAVPTDGVPSPGDDGCCIYVLTTHDGAVFQVEDRGALRLEENSNWYAAGETGLLALSYPENTVWLGYSIDPPTGAWTPLSGDGTTPPSDGRPLWTVTLADVNPDEDALANPDPDRDGDQKSWYAPTRQVSSALVDYLHATLPETAYGGVWTEVEASSLDPVGVVIPHIWAVDHEAVEKAIADYPYASIEPYGKVETMIHEAHCSLAQLKEVQMTVEKMELGGSSEVAAMLNEQYNRLSVLVVDIKEEADTAPLLDYLEKSLPQEAYSFTHQTYVNQDT